MGAPPVEVPHEQTQRHGELQIFDIAIGQIHRGPVIEHQQDAGNGEDHEEAEGKSAEAPGVRITHRALADARRVKVQPNVAEDVLGAVAGGVFPGAAAEHRAPNLGVDHVFFDFIEAGKGGHVFSLRF
jgi:uncharacterized protein YcfJ